MKEAAVLDANAAIGLAKGDCLRLLGALFRPVYVPSGVEHEVAMRGRGRPGSRELREAFRDGWAVRPSFSSDAMLSSDQEIVAVAVYHSVRYVLTGDVEVANAAIAAGLETLSAAEATALMKLQGLIPSARDAMDLMETNGFGIKPEERQRLLGEVGEDEGPG